MKKLKTVQDTNDPFKLNEALDSVLTTAKQKIDDSKGIVPVKKESIGAGSSIPDIKDNQLFTEFNDGKKRLLIKIDGEVYEIGTLTKVT